MAFSEAMNLAVRLVHQPAMIRSLRRRPLPSGITDLLEVAVGEEAALRAATETSSVPVDRLQHAAGFFIEQILLHHRSDSYRILGVTHDAEPSEMSRHLRLLMRWVHPDALGVPGVDLAMDRSIFASRVTGAWENLKTQERRAAYAARRIRSAELAPIRPAGEARRLRTPWSAWPAPSGSRDPAPAEAMSPAPARSAPKRTRFDRLFRRRRGSP